MLKMRKIEMGFTEPDMTPMIDIVFQLLTFFMIAINFENTKADERVKLPKDALAKPPVVKPEHELVLNYGYQRDPQTGSRIKPFPEIFYNERYVEVGRISKDLETERRVMEQLHGPDVIKDVTVLIRADSEIPTGLVQELIKRCQDAGFSKFSLRATAEEI
ncbi:ExbD/TolR family protein [Schlesneria paludicola]|uniref:ExbD/TolR family protein n=1 Tax=Schlesneria paludicola TaxID=360056 RepID=UPI00029B42D7|nr:biopolymer transporter ExbD [Schlesneria paludicola]